MDNIINEHDIKAIELPGRDLKWLITPGMELSRHMTMNTVVIKPGNTVKPAHAHPDKEELIYITSGKGKVYINGEVNEVSEGTAVLFRMGSVHMLKNDGNEDMKVVCVFSPPATIDDYRFYEDRVFPDR